METAPVAVPRPPAIGDLPPIFRDDEIFQVQAALIFLCESLRDRIALLDPPLSVSRDDKLGVGALRTWRKRFDSKYAALYYPWLRVVDPLRSNRGLTRDIPPSGHVAGQYANTDIQIGVHKAPANASLIWVQDVTVSINDIVHGVLNTDGVNVVRSFPSRGLRIYGARTTSSDTDWQFVNVRRLMMMIQKAIAHAIQWAVFEPNDTFTRSKLHLSLTSFLLELWQKGALMGAAPNEAFMVKCNEENNPPTERGNGRLLAEVGVAPSKPFEFVVLRVGRVNNEFEIAEEQAVLVGRRSLMSATAQRVDPVMAHNFLVSLLDTSSGLALANSFTLPAILDVVAGGFSECTGLEMSMKVEEYKEGGRNGTVLKFPNRVEWSAITLKKGLGGSADTLGIGTMASWKVEESDETESSCS